MVEFRNPKLESLKYVLRSCGNNYLPKSRPILRERFDSCTFLESYGKSIPTVPLLMKS